MQQETGAQLPVNCSVKRFPQGRKKKPMPIKALAFSMQKEGPKPLPLFVCPMCFQVSELDPVYDVKPSKPRHIPDMPYQIRNPLLLPADFLLALKRRWVWVSGSVLPWRIHLRTTTRPEETSSASLLSKYAAMFRVASSFQTPPSASNRPTSPPLSRRSRKSLSG